MVAWFVPVLIQQFYFVSRALCYGILSKSSPDTLWWEIKKSMIFWILTINPEYLLTISSTVGKIGSQTLILCTWVDTLLLNKQIHLLQLLLTQRAIVHPTLLLNKQIDLLQLLLTQRVIYLAQSSCLIQPITQRWVCILHRPGNYGKVTCFIMTSILCCV